MNANSPILAAEKISKSFRTVRALRNVSFAVRPGQVTCLLGDNGAGKSTLVKILSGVWQPTSGQIFWDGKPTVFNTPAKARAIGIDIVYQDLALFPLLNVVRNFYVGREPRAQSLAGIDWRAAGQVAIRELAKLGVEIDNPMRAIGTLSGGQRQCLAIARAIHFGARVLILDEPTASLGVKQALAVLELIDRAKKQNVGVVLITHNATHALAVGDTFTVLCRSESLGTLKRDEVDRERLQFLMAGAEEL